MRAWLGLALLALLLAGLFALVLVAGRTPLLDGLLGEAGFFRRCLVVHVNLALVVWLSSFVAALHCALPARRRLPALPRLGVALGGAGVAGLVACLAATDARPVLSNYVPVLLHPLFAAALLTFLAGVALTLLDGRLLAGLEAPAAGAPGALDVAPCARPGIRAAGLALLLALATALGAVAGTPDGLTPETRFELLAWGPGHVQQVATSCALGAAWLLLLSSALGRPVVSRGVASAAFAALVLPLLAAPLLAAAGTTDLAYHVGFTRLMQLGVLPPLGLLLLLCARALWRERRSVRLADPRVTGFLASGALTLVGFALGYLISGSNTVIPAHYHASVGAVTAAFMATTYVLLDGVGVPLPSPRHRRLAAWQPLLFGAGQVVFALGFALAGTRGMARKVYGVEQGARTLVETCGLGVMAAGGLVAVTGGALFLYLVGAAWRGHVVETLQAIWRSHGRRAEGRPAPTPTVDGPPLAPAGARGGDPDPLLLGVGVDRARPAPAGPAAVGGRA